MAPTTTSPSSSSSELKPNLLTVPDASLMGGLNRSASDSALSKLSNNESYPFRWEPLSRDEKMKRREVYFANGPWCVSPRASMLDLVRSEPGRVLMPRSFTELALAIFEMPLREDDVFICTYPKCGTTWTQEMVWQILHNLDFDAGKSSLQKRSPFLEMQALNDPNAKGGKVDAGVIDALKQAEEMDSPRVIKTHLPIDMLPPKLLETCKVVFVARNPMDCCVSFFHHERLVPKQGFAGSFEQYAELFSRGDNPMGDYFTHLKSGWDRRSHPNLKFLWFESMKKDLRSVISELVDFLDTSFTDAQIDALEQHLHIDNFRKNDSVNMKENFGKESTFIRSGKVGGWRSMFNKPEILLQWREWINENTLGTGLDDLEQFNMIYEDIKMDSDEDNDNKSSDDDDQPLTMSGKSKQ